MKQRHKRKLHLKHKHYRSLQKTLRNVFKRNVKYTRHLREDGSIGILPEYKWNTDDRKESFVVLAKMKKLQRKQKERK